MLHAITWALAGILGVVSLADVDGPQVAQIETAGLQFQYEGPWGLTEPVELDNGRTRVDLGYGFPDNDEPTAILRFEAIHLEDGESTVLREHLDAIELGTIDGLEGRLEDFELIRSEREEILGTEAIVIEYLCTNDSGFRIRQRLIFLILDDPGRLINIYVTTGASVWEEHHETMEQFLETLEPLAQPEPPAED